MTEIVTCAVIFSDVYHVKIKGYSARGNFGLVILIIYISIIKLCSNFYHDIIPSAR